MYHELQHDLEDHGEAHVRMDSGTEHELHYGNTEFDDEHEIIYKDERIREIVIDGSKIEWYYLPFGE